jgi:hypothetical protein
MSEEKTKPWKREFAWQYCKCGGPLVADTIKLIDGDKPMIPLAAVNVCLSCRKPSSMRMINWKAGVSVGMIKRTYRGGYAAFTLAEYEAGRDDGEEFALEDVPYDPDKFLEPRGA